MRTTFSPAKAVSGDFDNAHGATLAEVIDALNGIGFRAWQVSSWSRQGEDGPMVQMMDVRR